MKKLKRVYIEITNVCNLSCNFCPKTSRKPKFMQRDEFRHIVNEVKQITDYIYFHIMGEPLLNQELQYFLEESVRNHLKVNITTNGTLLPRQSEVLLHSKALRQINISLHSFEANEHDMELKEYINQVLDFVNQARAEGRIICTIRLWNMDSEELKGANGLNQEILHQIETNLGLDFSLSERLLKEHQLKLCDKVYLNMAEKFAWPDIKRAEIGEKVFCHGLRNQIGVLVDGTVVPCCLDSEGTIGLGNIHESSIKEILMGERARKIYDGFSNRVAVEELCRKCGYATRF